MKEQLIMKVLEMLLNWQTWTTNETKTIEEETQSDFIWGYVILRWYDSWVCFGKLDKIVWKSYYLSECRRLWYWKTKWLSLEDVATKWLLEWSKVSWIIDRVQITDERINMIIPTIEKVTKQILWYKEYVA